MSIKDLQARQGQVDLIAKVTEKGDVREFEKFGKKGRVCNAKIKDATGEMALTLWNEQIEQINVGAKIHIINGWVSEWQGEKQLTTGKFGQLEVIEESTDAKSADEEEANIKPIKKEEKEYGKDKFKDESSEDDELSEDYESEEDFIKDEEEIK